MRSHGGAYKRIMPDIEQGVVMAAESTKDMANQSAGKASSDSPALKPYRGKPAVRNFRGGNGNVGIIRSPVRAIALPDRKSARTVLCGGRSAMIVPTATASHSDSECLCPLLNARLAW